MTQDPDQPIPFTQVKFDELRAQQQTLLQDQKDVLVRLQTAREMGDLSENGAYRYAKFELGNIRRQLRTINDQLRRGYVPERAQTSASSSENQPQTAIEFDSLVELEGPTGLVKYHLVSEYESNPMQGKLGMTSPLGKLLLGKVSGQTVSLTTAKGRQTDYKIISVNPSSDAKPPKFQN